MDIKNFVSQTLQQLAAGVAKAKDNPGIRISPIPHIDPTSKTASGRLVENHGRGIINFVEFDLSVAVRSHVDGSAGAKAKLEVIALDLDGAELKSGVDHPSVQHIKFQVPVTFTTWS